MKGRAVIYEVVVHEPYTTRLVMRGRKDRCDEYVKSRHYTDKTTYTVRRYRA